MEISNEYLAPIVIEKIKMGLFWSPIQPKKWGKLCKIGSAVYLVAGCRIFILCEIHCYLCPPFFWAHIEAPATEHETV